LRRLIPVLMVLLVAAPLPLRAQEDPSSLPPGARIRISSSLFHGTGIYQGTRADTVVMRTTVGEERRVPVDSIRRLERSLGSPALGRSLGHGALAGAGGGVIAGAVGGALILALFCEPGSCTGDEWVEVMAIGAGVMGAVGAVSGGLLGLTYAVVRGERWQRVPLPEGLAVSVGADGHLTLTSRNPRRTPHAR
jgi:hypothetical protein